ncbi:MAG: hypothetical protein ABSG26_03895 [Bryobacteraceae bacterium]|jgi:hypothetical protein
MSAKTLLVVEPREGDLAIEALKAVAPGHGLVVVPCSYVEALAGGSGVHPVVRALFYHHGGVTSGLVENTTRLRRRWPKARLIVQAEWDDIHGDLVLDCHKAGAYDVLQFAFSRDLGILQARLEAAIGGQRGLRQIHLSRGSKVFVSTPYAPPDAKVDDVRRLLERASRKGIAAALRRHELEVIFADDVTDVRSVAEKICGLIGDSALLVANVGLCPEACSLHNPNVYAEIGMGIARGTKLLAVQPHGDPRRELPQILHHLFPLPYYDLPDLTIQVFEAISII